MTDRRKTNLLILAGIFFFAVLCGGCLFLTSSAFVNGQVTPKRFCLAFCAPVVWFLASLLLSNNNLSLKKLIFPYCLIITVLCLVQALYGIVQYFRFFYVTENFRIVGSFDNPAGFAASLCAGFPFFFYFIQKNKVWLRWFSIIAIAVVGIAVVLSASRAGIIALLVIGMFFLFYRLKIKTRNKIIIFSTICIITLSSLYFVKQDSADGRLLIWRCSWEMIKDKPLLGHGHGGFKANYMNYQAQYFETHPNSRYAMLADNVNRPFNEYIKLCVNYGLLGFLILLMFVFLLWRAYQCNPHKTLFTHIACWCLLAIAVLALFSYPLIYPFVWVMGIGSTLILMHSRYSTYFYRAKKFYCLLVLTMAIVICYMSCQRLLAETQWCIVAHKSLRGQTTEMLPKYQKLYPCLSDNELFLYNYAAELNVAGYYDESLQIGNECERLWADYDLQMLMADNYQNLQQWNEAEKCYQKAATMCPVKFMPLYKLYQLYETIGEKEKELEIACMIIDKPVKIMSPKIQQIKQEVKQKI